MCMSPKRRYPTDLTDRQWSIIEDLIPEVEPLGPGGRPLVHSKREIVNAILYVVRAGCAWRMLPKDFPPWQTVYRYFAQWRDDGTVDVIHDTLREEVRVTKEKKGRKPRNPTPSAGVIDSQSLRGADTVSAATRGYDAGKKVNGRKRHIVTDTLGLLLVVMVTTASVQDRDGGADILKLLRKLVPTVRHVFADGGYAGRLVEKAKRYWKMTVEVVKKPPETMRVLGAAEEVGRRADLCLAYAMAPSGSRLRAVSRDARGNGEVGDDRTDGEPPGAASRPETLGVGALMRL